MWLEEQNKELGTAKSNNARKVWVAPTRITLISLITPRCRLSAERVREQIDKGPFPRQFSELNIIVFVFVYFEKNK
jgi:hypothetical protein